MNLVYRLIIFLVGLLLLENAQSQSLTSPQTEETLTTIAFGSCNKHNKPQPLWKQITKHKPELWIWLGDNVYGDTDDMQVLAEKYTLQNEQKSYQRFRKRTPIIGIWDDHDYGKNDGGLEYAHKKESQQLLLDFLEVPQDAPQRIREGVYASYTFGKPGKQIKIILLDTRYFRDSLMRINGTYQINATGTILGQAQWQWLEEELRNSKADIHLIASSIQVIPEEHPYEKWANFPQDRNRLIGLLNDLAIKNPIILSGDRHIAEVSKWQNPKSSYTLYDITSSGLTHSGKTLPDEANQYRISPLIRDLNFGLMRIDWQKKQLKVEIRGEKNHLFTEQIIDFGE